MTEYRCPQCGDLEHLYMRADIRWNPHEKSWDPVDGSEEDYAVDCTECDWTGPLAECEFPDQDCPTELEHTNKDD